MIYRRCGGLWALGSKPWLWAARPGFDSLLGASPQCGLRGGRSHCNTVYCINNIIKSNKKKKEKLNKFV